MKTVTIRELNRRTAGVLDAVERGETFELRRNGKTVGFLTRTPPREPRKSNWDSHFAWLKKQPKGRGASLLEEFEEDRRRLQARERAMGNLS
jgi:antitoxin (DNA-binding transcriptional repressor) of toxin-antitoxin stability system